MGCVWFDVYNFSMYFVYRIIIFIYSHPTYTILLGESLLIVSETVAKVKAVCGVYRSNYMRICDRKEGGHTHEYVITKPRKLKKQT